MSAVEGIVSNDRLLEGKGMRMINEFASGNSLAILTAVFYLVFLVLDLVAPGISKFLLNAQFLGADVASLMPTGVSFENVAGTLLTLILSAWAFGYAWAWLYNRLEKYF